MTTNTFDKLAQHTFSVGVELELTLGADDIAKIDALDCGDRQANPDFSPAWD